VAQAFLPVRAKILGKVGDLLQVAKYGVRCEVAHHHVADHTLAQWDGGWVYTSQHPEVQNGNPGNREHDLFAGASTTHSFRAICISLAVVGVCLWMKFSTAGWLIIPGVIVYPGLCVVHFVVHYRARHNLSTWRTVVVSHLLFVTGFLLQWDQADSQDWLTITALLGSRNGVPRWWPIPAFLNFMNSRRLHLQWFTGGAVLVVMILLSLAVFVPTFVTYVMMFRTRYRTP
jgi:hypothetical protein